MTPKQQAFVNEYPIDHNATQAAIRAGYSAKTANAIGCENLTKPYISEAISALEAKNAEDCRVSVEDLTAKLRAAYDKAMATDNGSSAAVSAIGQIAKLHGLETAQRANENAAVTYVVEAPRKPKTAEAWLDSTGNSADTLQ